jgi:hypothetical protein
MAMLTRFLQGVELTPGQVAELRAITSLYYTQLATSDSTSSEKRSALDDLVLARVREMLQGDQRLLFDHNREAAQSAGPRRDAGTERRR